MSSITRDPASPKRCYVWGACVVMALALAVLMVALAMKHSPTATTQTAAAPSSSKLVASRGAQPMNASFFVLKNVGGERHLMAEIKGVGSSVAVR